MSHITRLFFLLLLLSFRPCLASFPRSPSVRATDVRDKFCYSADIKGSDYGEALSARVAFVLACRVTVHIFFFSFSVSVSVSSCMERVFIYFLIEHGCTGRAKSATWKASEQEAGKTATEERKKEKKKNKATEYFWQRSERCAARKGKGTPKSGNKAR